jgi:hypothetical protein
MVPVCLGIALYGQITGGRWSPMTWVGDGSAKAGVAP